MAEIRWTVEAQNDLDEIEDYIARDSPRNASAFVDALRAAAAHIADFPRMGRVLPGRNDPDLREMFFSDYRIVYKIRGDLVGIIAVWHGARDIRARLDTRGFDLGEYP